MTLPEGGERNWKTDVGGSGIAWSGGSNYDWDQSWMLRMVWMNQSQTDMEDYSSVPINLTGVIMSRVNSFVQPEEYSVVLTGDWRLGDWVTG